MKFLSSVLFLVVLVAYVSCGLLRDRRKICPQFCNKIYKPVCGSDGNTYGNVCMLMSAQCSDATLQLGSDGSCSASNKRNICTTPVCWPTYEPVCGSDGITYGNGCHFWNAHCYDTDLKIEHNGPCDGWTTPSSFVPVYRTTSKTI